MKKIIILLAVSFNIVVSAALTDDLNHLAATLRNLSIVLQGGAVSAPVVVPPPLPPRDDNNPPPPQPAPEPTPVVVLPSVSKYQTVEAAKTAIDGFLDNNYTEPQLFGLTNEQLLDFVDAVGSYNKSGGESNIAYGKMRTRVANVLTVRGVAIPVAQLPSSITVPTIPDTSVNIQSSPLFTRRITIEKLKNSAGTELKVLNNQYINVGIVKSKPNTGKLIYWGPPVRAATLAESFFDTNGNLIYPGTDLAPGDYVEVVLYDPILVVPILEQLKKVKDYNAKIMAALNSSDDGSIKKLITIFKAEAARTQQVISNIKATTDDKTISASYNPQYLTNLIGAFQFILNQDFEKIDQTTLDALKLLANDVFRAMQPVLAVLDEKIKAIKIDQNFGKTNAAGKKLGSRYTILTGIQDSLASWMTTYDHVVNHAVQDFGTINQAAQNFYEKLTTTVPAPGQPDDDAVARALLIQQAARKKQLDTFIFDTRKDISDYNPDQQKEVNAALQTIESLLRQNRLDDAQAAQTKLEALIKKFSGSDWN